MKNYFNLRIIDLSLLFSFLVSTAALGTTCTKPDDWVDAVCKYAPLQPNERCWTDPVSAGNMASQCNDQVADCNQTPEGHCFGSVPPDHWVVTGTAADGIRRCRCGCFAEETTFYTPESIISAKELYSRKGVDNQLLTNDQVGSWQDSYHSVNGLLAGPEKELVYKITTESGKSIVISSVHPVLVSDGNGKIKTIKQARDVTKDDLLVNDDGYPEYISKIAQKKYAGLMINFNVVSDDAAQHVVLANGLRMGDNAWQQYLANKERRFLKRTDLLLLLNKSLVK